LHCLSQVPLISITERLKKRLKSDTWGNYTFWICFCIVGQPVCLMMYYHDYILARHQQGLTALQA
jgi:diacylglycerol O-acyltransferase-1